MRRLTAASWLVFLVMASASACGRLGFDDAPAGDGDGDASPIGPDAGQPFLVLEPTGGGAVGDNFGWSVAISGDLLVVGAPTADTGVTSDSGSAFVFTHTATDGWTQLQALEPIGATVGARFGERVAIAGDAILVAASAEDGDVTIDAGAVYVFRHEGAGYQQVGIIAAEDGASADFFGIAMAARGTRAIVGAHYDDPSERGAAYIFDTDGGAFLQRAKLLAESTVEGDNFGAAVSISTDLQWVAIGAPYKSDGALASVGAAYIFQFDGEWIERADLRPTDAHENMFFGFDVAIDGEWMAVGASQENLPGRTDAGAVYFYRLVQSVWVLHSVVEPSDSAADAQFGNKIALHGTTAVVGAPFARGGGGALYRFELEANVWTEKALFVGPDDGEGHLGEGLAFEDDKLIGGAHRALDATGRVYVSQ